MIGLAGRRVPIALAVVPASIVSVLLSVGGIGIWSGLDQMVANLVAGGAEDIEIIGAIIFQLGPTLLFPVWGVALAVATLGYYYRRRGPCSVCGRGAPGKAAMDPRFSKTDKDTYQSSDFESAANKVEIPVKSGAGNVEVNTK